jgi:hypothetical protein
MKKTICFLVLVNLTSLGFSQKIATKNIKCDPFWNFNNFILLENGEKSFIISKFKTTNREYLCFLQWTYTILGTDYPEVYQAILPDTTKFPDIFNPSKANLPVKGISLKQAQAFCSWRSDRLNEYILIREGILRKDFSQSNEENFNTESYLCNQYEGLVRNDLVDLDTKGVRKVLHPDYILVPGFYVATKDEIKTCDSLIKLVSLKPPKKISSDLDWWMNNQLDYSFMDNKKSPLAIFKTKLSGENLSGIKHKKKFIKKYQLQLAKDTISFDPVNVLVSEIDYRTFNLPHFKSQMRYYKLLTDSLPNPFNKSSFSKTEEKDSLGRMNFIYIADNTDGTPILINRAAFEEHSSADISNNGFYCAMNIPYRIYIEFQKFLLVSYTYTLYRY